jgi:type IV pilus assembly protein PilB
MKSPRIGQILSTLVPLSNHDVEEILEEQKATRQRFGDAALALGLVRPQHVWEAWIQQMSNESGEIDLDQVGIDSQALDRLSGDLAQKHRVVPIRTSGDQLLVVCAGTLSDGARDQMQKQCGMRIIVTTARSGQVDAAIKRLYAPTSCCNAA